jgi:hypothetical protein
LSNSGKSLYVVHGSTFADLGKNVVSAVGIEPTTY